MEEINCNLHTEKKRLNSLVGVAQQLLGLSNQLESIVSGNGFMQGCFNDDVLSAVDTLRCVVNEKLIPTIGVATVEYHTQP